ncbi:hypothetical protein JMJ56_11795 [Belnapia sp. T18]|uniref:Papain-like cysteine peptidase n=1 Tax=Belnapia arida TaxID=2804533 RepID=A0ABS1U200_9PROT|nr:LytR C-terminal domain-containing protein [Belnapia arida]MBL6078692.1 hypothetical protein [Belnapia arida]
MSEKFEEYISLGSDCEVGFQFRRVLGRDSSSFFSWNVTGIAALERLLATRFDGVLQEADISAHADGSMLLDGGYGYKFHSPFRGYDFRADPDYAARWADHLEKAGYLIAKFLRGRPAGHRTAYFYKIEPEEEVAELRRLLPAVRGQLLDIHGPSHFELVVVLPQDRFEEDWGEARIHNRYVRRLAPWHDATDGHVSSWDRIFSEFPHTEPLRLAGY